MRDNATTELEYLLLRARELLEAIVGHPEDSDAALVGQLLTVRTQIEQELERNPHPEGRDLVSDLDEEVRRLAAVVVEAAGGSLESLRAQDGGQHLDWWWHLDSQSPSPVAWAIGAEPNLSFEPADQIPALRLGRTAAPSGARLSLPLMRNTQFIYELNLARLELAALNGDPEVEVLSDLRKLRTRHYPDREDLLRQRLAYFEAVNMTPTVYYGLQRYNITRSINQYLTHWFYAYKGKFHPQVVRALLNILRVAPGATVLDPFSGVGTTALECMILGIHSVSVDISQVATRVALAKVETWGVLDQIQDSFPHMLEHPPLWTPADDGQPPLIAAEGPVHAGREEDVVQNFFVVASLIAHSDTGRRKRDFLASYQDRCRKMLQSVKYLQKAVRDLDLQMGHTDIRRGDVRQLPIENESIDAIITSPPYSIALNYVENDKHALHALGLSMDAIKGDYIGVRGSGDEKILAYEQDMRLAIIEIARVLKPGGRCAIIIGNPTHFSQPVEADRLVDRYCQEEGLQILEDRGLDMSHNIPKTVYGLYNVINVEQILLFAKPGVGAKLLST